MCDVCFGELIFFPFHYGSQGSDPGLIPVCAVHTVTYWAHRLYFLDVMCSFKSHLKEIFNDILWYFFYYKEDFGKVFRESLPYELWFFSILIYLDMQCVIIANVSLNYYRWNRTQDSSLICPLFKWSLKVSFFSFGAVQFHRGIFTYELLLSSSSSWMSKVYSTVSYDDMRCKVIMFFKIAPVPFCLLCLLWALNRSVHALSFCAPDS